MDYVIMIGQLFLSLSILIVLHEGGHFLPAKMFGTRVEKFYLFFDPWFSLFKFKKGETEYGIGWLPLGGYVKISGMIDESLDTEQMKEPPQPWEFRSKTPWQRLIIMLGGVTVNFILGFLIWGMVLFVWGEEYFPNENIKYGIHAGELGKEMGLQSGDKIVSVAGLPFDKFNDRAVVREIIINDAKEMVVERDNREVRIDIDPKFVGILSNSKNKDRPLFLPRLPFTIAEFPSEKDSSAARDAGLKVDDQIIEVNGQPTPFYDQFVDVAETNKGKTLPLIALRNGSDTFRTNITLSNEGKAGAFRYTTGHFFDSKRQDYALGSAMATGVSKGWSFLADQVKAFGQIFSGKIKAKDSLGGFGSIAKMFDVVWEWERFWRMTAILSLILAFMNLLPIPALDGGHVMFLLYEVVTGRKPSDKFMEYATIIGFVLVLSLVIYANALDFFR